MPLFEDLRMGSENRLWELVEDRTRAGADLEAIDRLIWDLFGEEWAVVFTDLAGFSRQAERFGIIHFLQVIYESKKLLFPVISQFGGFLVKAEGDSFMLLFRGPARAIECVIEMQRVCHKENQRRVEEDRILLCAGVGFGKILRIGEHEVWGKEVNAASKLGEDRAIQYEILATDAVRNLCDDMDGIRFEKIADVAAGSRCNHRIHYELTP
jgi:adenylate cyclase